MKFNNKLGKILRKRWANWLSSQSGRPVKCWMSGVGWMPNILSAHRGLKHTDISRLLSYLAGFADADGCFRYASTTRMSVINCYYHVLVLFEMLFGGSIRRKPGRTPDARCCYEWEVSGSNARFAARCLAPFLHEKEQQARILCRIMDYPLRSEERRIMAQCLHNLKTMEYSNAT